MSLPSTTPRFATAFTGRALLRVQTLKSIGLFPLGLLLALPAQK